jgi:type IV secretory pathway VirB4 component
LRLPLHRGTTAHIASIYPFSVQAPLGSLGPYVGTDLLTGGAEFCWDPFDAYRAGVITNPNVWVLGEPGNGKSALVKCLLWRMAAVYGPGRWIAIADPKGEYLSLAEALGLNTVRLSPGGTVRINPLAPGPAAAHEPEDRRVLRQGEMLATLVATVLDRPLSQLEDAALFAAIEQLVRSPTVEEPTLPDVAALVGAPPAQMLDRLHRTDARASDDLAVVRYGLDKLLSRSLRGMFDGPSTVPLVWDGPGLHLDLSAVPLESEALPLVMVAAAGWLRELMACPGPQRVQVIDEAWALMARPATTSYLQSCFKLGRTYGAANICITHRASDLAAQAGDGSAAAKIAAGLLADSATKVILRQAPDQLELATTAFGLTPTEAQIVGQLTRGRALWKIGGRHTALVHHHMSPTEESLCDTDHKMRGDADDLDDVAGAG